MNSARSREETTRSEPDFSSSTNTLQLFKAYAPRIPRSADLYLAAITATILFVLSFCFIHKSTILNLLVGYVSLATTLIGVIIAGFAILITVGDVRLLDILARKRKTTAMILFSFRYCAILAACSIATFAGLAMIISGINGRMEIALLFAISSFLFFYTLYATCYLVIALDRLFKVKLEIAEVFSPADVDNESM